jgi:hypothetical protein
MQAAVAKSTRLPDDAGATPAIPRKDIYHQMKSIHHSPVWLAGLFTTGSVLVTGLLLWNIPGSLRRIQAQAAC